MHEQLQFFASLDFPGRTTLTVAEIAERLGVTERHVFNEVERGKLGALNLAATADGRQCLRIPIESYRNYVLGAMTATADTVRLLKHLPRTTLQELLREIRKLLE